MTVFPQNWANPETGATAIVRKFPYDDDTYCVSLSTGGGANLSADEVAYYLPRDGFAPVEGS